MKTLNVKSLEKYNAKPKIKYCEYGSEGYEIAETIFPMCESCQKWMVENYLRLANESENGN